MFPNTDTKTNIPYETVTKQKNHITITVNLHKANLNLTTEHMIKYFFLPRLLVKLRSRRPYISVAVLSVSSVLR